MLVECINLKEKVQLCNVLGDYSRTFLSEDDFSKKSLNKYIRNIIRKTVTQIEDSPCIEKSCPSLYTEPTSGKYDIKAEENFILDFYGCQPIVINNICFRSMLHAYYYFKANQDTKFLALILAEDKPDTVKWMYNRGIQDGVIQECNDSDEVLIYSILKAKFKQYPLEQTELVRGLGKANYIFNIPEGINVNLRGILGAIINE